VIFGETQPGGACDTPPRRAGSWSVGSEGNARGSRLARPSPICPFSGAGSLPHLHSTVSWRPLRGENANNGMFPHPTGLRASHHGCPSRPGPADHARMLRVGIGTAKLPSRSRQGAGAPSLSTRTAEPVWVKVVCSPQARDPQREGAVRAMKLSRVFRSVKGRGSAIHPAWASQVPGRPGPRGRHAATGREDPWWLNGDRISPNFWALEG